MIEFSHVTKLYGQKAAVKDLSFEVKAGEVLALLGPNGAGKSTTMKMLTGFLPATKGEISVCNFDMRTSPGAAQSLIGYLPEGTPLYTEATVTEFLRFAAAARDIPAKEEGRAVARVIDRCGLKNVEKQLIDTLSKGYRQRTCFAQSIIHDPDVLVMDEPTDGLDPGQKHGIQEMIREMGQSKSIVLSTHIMEEAEYMSDRILLLRQGQAAAVGTIDELRDDLCDQKRIRLTLGQASGADVAEGLSSLSDVQKVEPLERSAAGKQSFLIWAKPEVANPSALLSQLVHFCSEKAWDIIEIKTLEADLKEIFLEATEAGAFNNSSTSIAP